MMRFFNPLFLYQKLVGMLRYEIVRVRCSSKLALSFSLGLFIAFSPYIGLHNIMALFCSWWLSLSFPLLLIISNLNNPWTMTPIYCADYMVGSWIVRVTGVCVDSWSPSWFTSFNLWVNTLVGTQICLPTFLIGGTVLALTIAVTTFFCVKFYLMRVRAIN